MIGTIVNTCCIIVGTLAGTFFKKGLGEKYTKTLFNAMGLASLALGANSFVQNMPKSEFPVLFILSLAIGGLIGTAWEDKTPYRQKGRGKFRNGTHLRLSPLLYRDLLHRRTGDERHKR